MHSLKIQVEISILRGRRSKAEHILNREELLPQATDLNLLKGGQTQISIAKTEILRSFLDSDQRRGMA